MEQITLYYRQGASDKVYQARIEPKENGYAVLFAFGRRGSTLNTGTKTQSPVPYEQAKAIYEKLVQEKMAKGYTPGEDGTPYQHTDKASQHTGFHCQLLNQVEEKQVERLIEDPSYWLQEKMDGRRLLLRKTGSDISGINRLGLTVSVPQPMIQSAQCCPLDFLLDGEAIGDQLHVFDVLKIGSEDLRQQPYRERYVRLMNLLGAFQHRHLTLVPCYLSPERKREVLDELKTRNVEGVVFKHMEAPYTPGRPTSGGSQLKYKFCETASFIVGNVNSKRSVGLLLFTADKVVNAGNVTIPPNHEVPSPGSIVECRYLYAFQESGCIFQPVYLGAREDMTAEECTTTQLKYKAEPAEVAA